MDRVILEILSGRFAGARSVIAPGGRLRIGRTERADVMVPDDVQMSSVHFAIAWSGTRCILSDEGSIGGTRLNGELVETGAVRNGAWIRAGTTDFSLYFEGTTPPPGGEPEPSAAQADALSALHAEPHPLFAVLDAARDSRILTLLHESVDPHRSLYEGVKGRAIEEWAPYLVELVSDSELSERLVVEGWSKRWGVYLTSPRPFKEVRTHLRRFLMVEDEEAGEEMYFRYYDPAVLRVFLPASTRRQSESFFGKQGSVAPVVACFMAEGERGELLRFAAS